MRGAASWSAPRVIRGGRSAQNLAIFAGAGGARPAPIGRPSWSTWRIRPAAEIDGFLRFSSAWRVDVGRPMLDGLAERRRFLRFLARRRQPARLRPAPRSRGRARRLGGLGAGRRPPCAPFRALPFPRGLAREAGQNLDCPSGSRPMGDLAKGGQSAAPATGRGARVEWRAVKPSWRVGVPSPWITFGKAASYCSR